MATGQVYDPQPHGGSNSTGVLHLPAGRMHSKPGESAPPEHLQASDCSTFPAAHQPLRAAVILGKASVGPKHDRAEG